MLYKNASAQPDVPVQRSFGARAQIVTKRGAACRVFARVLPYDGWQHGLTWGVPVNSGNDSKRQESRRDHARSNAGSQIQGTAQGFGISVQKVFNDYHTVKQHGASDGMQDVMYTLDAIHHLRPQDAANKEKGMQQQQQQVQKAWHRNGGPAWARCREQQQQLRPWTAAPQEDVKQEARSKQGQEQVYQQQGQQGEESWRGSIQQARRQAEQRPLRGTSAHGGEHTQRQQVESWQARSGQAGQHSQQHQQQEIQQVSPEQPRQHVQQHLEQEQQSWCARAEQGEQQQRHEKQEKWQAASQQAQRHRQQQHQVQTREASSSEQPQLHVPSEPTFRAADKTYLKPTQRAELARMLRKGGRRNQSSQPSLRVFRHAIDDLRLFKALEAAGVAGLVVVADRMEEADVVLATRRKRTGKDVPLVEVKRAAQTAGLPYFELPAVSALRVMDVLAPLLGIPVPEHLLQQRQAAAMAHLPRQVPGEPGDAAAMQQQAAGTTGKGSSSVVTGASADVLAAQVQNPHRSSGRAILAAAAAAASFRSFPVGLPTNAVPPSVPAAVVAGSTSVNAPMDGHVWTEQALTSLALPAAMPRFSPLERLQMADTAPDDLLDGIDAAEDRKHMLPHNSYDRLGHRHAVKRVGEPNGKLRRRRLLQQMAEDRAPW